MEVIGEPLRPILILLAVAVLAVAQGGAFGFVLLAQAGAENGACRLV
jgi:hypothetical protein